MKYRNITLRLKRRNWGWVLFLLLSLQANAKDWTREEVKDIVYQVNNTWQRNHGQERSFWDPAVYHTGNMEAFFLFKNLAWYNYSKEWAISMNVAMMWSATTVSRMMPRACEKVCGA